MSNTLQHSSKHRLLRHYQRMFPPTRGLYLNRETERWMRHEEAKDRARALMAAVDSLGANVNADELADAINDVAPDKEWMVEPRERYDELRDHYAVLFTLVDELTVLVKNGGVDAPGRMVELVRDALRFGSDLDKALRSPPEEFA